MSYDSPHLRRGEGGFSLLELLIVAAVIAIIVTIALFNTTRARQLAHEKIAISRLTEIVQLEAQYRVALGNGSQYGTLADLRAAQTASGPLMPANLAPADSNGQPVASNGWTIRDIAGSSAPAIATENSGGWTWAVGTRPSFAIEAVPDSGLKATYQYCVFEDGAIRRVPVNQTCTRNSELATDQ